MRKLATIRRISKIKPIPGADAIEVASVDGWKAVVKKGEFSEGQRVLYIECDAFLPEGNNAWQFLVDKQPTEFNGQRGHVLRSVKLRGQLSQGLILSMEDAELGIIRHWSDEELDERLGIKLWERMVHASLAGQVAGNFPTHLFPKTDQERAQNLTDKIFGEWKDLKWEITTKLDGSSCTVAVHEGVNYVCSRNVWLKIEGNEGNSFVDIAVKSGLLDALAEFDKEGRPLAVQGELMGPGIQGNQERLQHHKLFIYDIYDIKAQRYLGCFERCEIVNELYDLGVEGCIENDLVAEVPVIEEAVTLARHGIRNLDDLLAFADGPSLNRSALREGLVFKSQPVGVSFKVISNKWLLGQKD